MKRREVLEGDLINVANIIEEGRVGGPQIRVVYVAKALKGSVSTLVVFPRQESEEFKKVCKKNGVKFLTLSLEKMSRLKLSLIKYVFRFPIEVFLIKRHFTKKRYDLIHVSGGSWQYKGVIAGWLSGTPVVWHLNDTSMPSVIRVAFRLLAPLVSGFIFASNRSQEYYGGSIPRRPSWVIPAPVDVTVDNPEAIDCSDPLNADLEGKYVVGTVANINPIKGIETFLRAANAVIEKEQTVEFRFVLVGPIYDTQSGYFRLLKKIIDELGIEENVVWAGAREDVRPLLHRMDLYVCSSNAESSPMAVWEAMAMGNPVVSTDVGDVPLHVKDGVSGYVVPVRDHDLMAKRVLGLVENPERAAEMGRAAREHVVKELDVSRCAEKHLEAYRALVECKGRG